MDDYINSSVFELYKVGPGPSSSHTIGPMRAAGVFLTRAGQAPINGKAVALEVRLCGSLAATGAGHGTDRAVAAGLIGQKPETCDTVLLAGLLKDDTLYEADFGAFELNFNRKSIIFDDKAPCPVYQNTMIFRLLDAAGSILYELTIYSTGGGFISVSGEEDSGSSQIMVPYRYRDMNGLQRLVSKYGVSIAGIMLENEKAITGKSEVEINAGLDRLIQLMNDAVSRGIATDGVLPGPIGLHRKAAFFHKSSATMQMPQDRFLARLNAWALAASEENAAGNLVITAPTSGSAGILPGIVRMLIELCNMEFPKIREGLLTAAAIGMIARRNASISGAEVGCQGEIGVASAMAAAMLSAVSNCSAMVIECAAEIALEHHLGLTCDPVLGYVQIPCIERNAMGAVTAYNAYIMASTGNPQHQKVSFDEVVSAMLETGRKMCPEFKETSKGGLAVCSLCE